MAKPMKPKPKKANHSGKSAVHNRNRIKGLAKLWKRLMELKQIQQVRDLINPPRYHDAW